MVGPYLDYLGFDVYGHLYDLPASGGRFAVGVHGLRGCTVVLVISKKAVYTSHLQEVPLFRDMDDIHTDEEEFKQVAVEPLLRGMGRTPGLISLTNPGKAFHPSEQPQIVIVTPFTPKMYDLCIDTALTYEALVQELARDLSNVVKGGPKTIVRGYDQEEYDHPIEPMLLDSAAGRVIFEYDPASKDYRVWIGPHLGVRGNVGD